MGIRQIITVNTYFHVHHNRIIYVQHFAIIKDIITSIDFDLTVCILTQCERQHFMMQEDCTKYSMCKLGTDSAEILSYKLISRGTSVVMLIESSIS